MTAKRCFANNKAMRVRRAVFKEKTEEIHFFGMGGAGGCRRIGLLSQMKKQLYFLFIFSPSQFLSKHCCK